MQIRKSTERDLSVLMAIFDEARGTIARLGINQWQDGYPSLEVVTEDVALGRSYAIEAEGEVCGTFVLIDDGEPTYDRIESGHWLTGDESRSYVAIHRVAVAVKNRGRGISAGLLEYAARYAAEQGRISLRIDTHEGNVVMRRMLEKNGFSYCGVIHLANGDPRVAYEKRLSQEVKR